MFDMFPYGSIVFFHRFARCSARRYAVGEDGCLRVQPLPTAAAAAGEKPDLARRNFRISPMPLSALAAAWVRSD